MIVFLTCFTYFNLEWQFNESLWQISCSIQTLWSIWGRLHDCPLRAGRITLSRGLRPTESLRLGPTALWQCWIEQLAKLAIIAVTSSTVTSKCVHSVSVGTNRKKTYSVQIHFISFWNAMSICAETVVVSVTFYYYSQVDKMNTDILIFLFIILKHDIRTEPVMNT